MTDTFERSQKFRPTQYLAALNLFTPPVEKNLYFSTLPAQRKSNAKNFATQSLRPKSKSGKQQILEWFNSRKGKKKEKFSTGSLPRDFSLAKKAGYYGRKFHIHSREQPDSWSSQPPGLSRYMDLSEDDFFEIATEPTMSSMSRRTLTRYDPYGNIVNSPEDYYKTIQKVAPPPVPLPAVDYSDSEISSETSESIHGIFCRFFVTRTLFYSF